MRYLINKNKFLLFVILLTPLCLLAQEDTTLLKSSGHWLLKLGAPVFIPTNDNYIYKGNESEYGINDGYHYNYSLRPICTFGSSVDLLYSHTLYSSKISKLILAYGFGYKQSRGRIMFSGYYEGGISGNSYLGNGSRFFKQHYIEPIISCFYFRNFKCRKNSFLTGITFNADYLIKTDVQSEFKSNSGANNYFEQKDNYTYWNNKNGATKHEGIQWSMNYELGWIFRITGKWSVSPTIKTSILNINKLFGKQEEQFGFSSFESVKDSYSKGVTIGIMITY